MPASRCQWVNLKNPLYIRYHDEEWGVPSRDDACLYEMLLLEMFVAGLSWECVLNKREAFRAAFAGFNPQAVAAFGEAEVAALLQNPGIIRHRGKIQAAIANTRIFLQIQEEYGSFAAYAWGFTRNEVLREPYTLRTTSPLSDAFSRDLRRRGMRFFGSTAAHSWLQAVGIINGHGEECEHASV
ncbi:MAG: DNA-3-methyladenine glycosylase I [Akkermansia sp.]|nr:DNA-3-methyladenine glycosylase I [Akkermansia sp.]